MDIIAESLSVQQFDVNSKMTINGLDIVDYIESKLSTGVEFIGGYSDISDAPKENGYIAIVGTKEYIYSKSQSKWLQIGDETLYGQIAEYLENAPNYVLKSELSEYVKSSELSEIPELKANIQYLGTLSTDNILSAAAGSMAYESKDNYLTATSQIDFSSESAISKKLSFDQMNDIVVKLWTAFNGRML